MNVRSLYRPGVATLLAFALCTVTLGGCAKKDAAGEPAATAAPAAKTPGGAETPEALVERMKKAAADKNMSEVVACLAPEARKQMSAAMYMGATMMVAFSQMGAQMGDAMMGGMENMAEGMGGKMSAEDQKKADEAKAKAAEEMGKLTEKYNGLMKKYGLPQMPKEGEAEPAELSKDELDKIFNGMDHGAFVTDVMAMLEAMPGDKSDNSDAPFALKDGKLEGLTIDGDKASGTVAGEPVKFVKVDGRWYLDADMGPGMGDGMGEGMDQEDAPMPKPGA